MIESGDNFLLYNIDNQYDRAPDLNDEIIKGEIVEFVYQKGKFDYNRKIIEEIQSDEFNENKFIPNKKNHKWSCNLNNIFLFVIIAKQNNINEAIRKITDQFIALYASSIVIVFNTNNKIL